MSFNYLKLNDYLKEIQIILTQSENKFPTPELHFKNHYILLRPDCTNSGRICKL
jgi:hypothetical protein